MKTLWPIVELRQYLLHPGKRDVLIDLFEREFVESQEAVGMRIVGQFRDIDQPDHFVWLRAFADMTSRSEGLSAFYDGPVWQAHRDVANDTMEDSDNVLLLRAARPTSSFARNDQPRPAKGATATAEGLVIANIYYFDAPAGPDFVQFFEGEVQPELANAGLPVLSYFISETGPNGFPRLPVRESDHVFVWFSKFADQADYERGLDALVNSPHWRDVVSDALNRKLNRPPEVLRLQPTPRSQLRY